ncbi:hypothetical protein M1M92_04925 [Peptococcaceae bacterium]|nr:hypothetical protein [Peptococcaceae bacterium]
MIELFVMMINFLMEQYNYLFAIVADALISRISRYENHSWNEPGCVPLWAIYLAELLMKEMKVDFQTRAVSTFREQELTYEYMDEKTVEAISTKVNEFLKENYPGVEVVNVIGKECTKTGKRKIEFELSDSSGAKMIIDVEMLGRVIVTSGTHPVADDSSESELLKIDTEIILTGIHDILLDILNTETQRNIELENIEP